MNKDQKYWFKSPILIKKSIDLNRDLNQWFESTWFKSTNPDIYFFFLSFFFLFYQIFHI